MKLIRVIRQFAWGDCTWNVSMTSQEDRFLDNSIGDVFSESNLEYKESIAVRNQRNENPSSYEINKTM